MINNGYLLIADITGYTRYLTDSELEHATKVLESLIGAIVEHTVAPFRISNFQGDAVFSYAPSEGFLTAQAFLEATDYIYGAFVDHKQ